MLEGNIPEQFRIRLQEGQIAFLGVWDAVGDGGVIDVHDLLLENATSEVGHLDRAGEELFKICLADHVGRALVDRLDGGHRGLVVDVTP